MWRRSVVTGEVLGVRGAGASPAQTLKLIPDESTAGSRSGSFRDWRQQWLIILGTLKRLPILDVLGRSTRQSYEVSTGIRSRETSGGKERSNRQCETGTRLPS